MSSSLERMLTSTPIQESPTNRLKAQILELQRSLSKLALENEELKYEQAQMRIDLDDLNLENQRLCQIIRDKEKIQAKMGEQIKMVSSISFQICEKFKAYRSKGYERDAWLQCANDEK